MKSKGNYTCVMTFDSEFFSSSFQTYLKILGMDEGERGRERKIEGECLCLSIRERKKERDREREREREISICKNKEYKKGKIFYMDVFKKTIHTKDK